MSKKQAGKEKRRRLRRVLKRDVDGQISKLGNRRTMRSGYGQGAAGRGKLVGKD